MTTAFINGRIISDVDILDDHIVTIEGDTITDVSRNTPLDNATNIIDLNGAILAPGYIDTQVNGGGGVLFNENPSVQAIREIGEAHRTFGTCGFLPTLISDDLDTIEAAIKAVETAIHEGVPGVLGIHIEGPFLNVERKGIHDATKFRTLAAEHISLLSSLSNGKTLVTLAPEIASPKLISDLVSHDVIVSAGHTNATYSTTADALAAGVTGFTHLFNAMSQFINREPGVVGAALENSESWCGLIIDGHHVSKAALNIALKCKTLDKLMLVTDAMPTVGSQSKTFTLQSKTIKVINGACVSEDGTLAGSDLDMAQAVQNAMSMLGIDIASAVKMATSSPAHFLGLGSTHGKIARGYRANFVALSENATVLNTWINGKVLDTQVENVPSRNH